MRTLLLAGATVALLAAVHFAPAMAQGPKASDDNAWPGMSQRVDRGSANAAADNPTLRVPIRLRAPRSMAGSLGPGPLADSLSKRLR
jgi:hypothetical protein